jgi:CheY-like chemotaxis protein
MRLTIIKRPAKDMPGFCGENFEVGVTYDVGPQVAGLLIAERCAEIVSDSSAEAVFGSPGRAAAARGVVMVVDDEPDMQRLTQTLLALDGYRVVVARHGQEAIRLLKDQQTDLIVLDLKMPVMDGWQFRAEQRRLPPRLASVPVLVLSSEDDVSDQAAALKAAGGVRKPFKAEVLLDAVRRAIG